MDSADAPIDGRNALLDLRNHPLRDGAVAYGGTALRAGERLAVAAERFDRVMLLNGRLLGFGRSETVFTSERLLSAYGGHIRMLDTGDGTLIVNDTCCDP